MKITPLKNVSLVLMAFCLMATSCTESLESVYEDKPIVESYLYVGKPILIKITRITPYDANAPKAEDDINNLTVTILEGNQEITLQPIGDGIYESSADFKVQESVDYTIQFYFNKKEVKATTRALTKPKEFTQSVTSITVTVFSGSFTGGMPDFPDPVKTNWSNPENDYYLVVVENTEENPDAINDFGNVERPARLFRNEPTQTNSYDIRAQQFQYYGEHRIILFHISPEYSSLYKDSGTTSQNISTPPTNVINGLGIFTAIHSDTLLLTVNKN